MGLVVLSLFDGESGGLMALKRAGIDLDAYYASEIEEKAISFSKKNFSEVIHVGSVTEISYEDGILKTENGEYNLPKIDLLLGGSPCFTEGNNVLTLDGYKDIKNVKVGDSVLTHNGNWKKVLKVGGSYKETYMIKSQGMLETETTYNHPYFVKENKNSKPIWKKAGELIKGDYVSLPIIKEEIDNWNLTDDECYIIGRYIADGHTRKDFRISENRPNDRNWQLILSVGSHKIPNIELKHSLYKHSKNVHRMVFSNKRLVQIVEKECGQISYDKKISSNLLKLPKEKLKIILKGLLDGDGSYRKDQHRLTTVSKELAQSICLAVAKVYKTACSIEFTKRPETTIIEGRVVNQRDTYTVTFKKVIKEKSKFFIEGDYIWLPVKKFRNTNSFKNVYNIEVEDDNSYTVNNIIVHNCQGFSRQGVGLNFEDPRSKLFFKFAELYHKIKEENPNLKVMLENVYMKKDWENVISEYMGIKPLDFNSDKLVPQNRPRLYWTNFDVKLPSNVEYKLLDILDDIKLVDYKEINGIKICNSYNEDTFNIIDIVNNEVRIKQATKQGYIVAEPGDGINLSFPKSKTRRGRVTKNRSACLDTSCNLSVYDQHGQIRPFTINELCKLQTIDSKLFKGQKEKDIKRMLGNGWTIDVIAYILNQMVEKEIDNNGI